MPASFDDYMLDTVFCPFIASLRGTVLPIELALYPRALAVIAMLISLAQVPDNDAIMTVTIIAMIALLYSFHRFLRFAQQLDLAEGLRSKDRGRRLIGLVITVILSVLILTGRSWSGIGMFLCASILCNVSNWLLVCYDIPANRQWSGGPLDERFEEPS